jgi:ankyrin repeat protein
MTPLMAAASGNHAEVAKLLLENKADPQLKNLRGKTAMDLVSRSPLNKEIRLLFVDLGLMKPAQPESQKP